MAKWNLKLNISKEIKELKDFTQNMNNKTELDDIVSAILDREHDYVTSIEFEDEEIYEG